MQGAVLSRRRAEDALAAACQPGRHAEHQDGGEQRRGAAGDVEPDLVDGHALAPAGHARHGLHQLRGLALVPVEALDIVGGDMHGGLQVVAELPFGGVDLFAGYPEHVQVGLVEAAGIGFHRRVAVAADGPQDLADGGFQAGGLESGPREDLRPQRLVGMEVYFHRRFFYPRRVRPLRQRSKRSSFRWG